MVERRCTRYCVQAISRLSQLLPIRDDDRVYICYKAFADWPPGDKRSFHKSQLIVNRCTALRRLASACGVPLMRLLSEDADSPETDTPINAFWRLVEVRDCIVHNAQYSLAFERCFHVERGKIARSVALGLHFCILCDSSRNVWH